MKKLIESFCLPLLLLYSLSLLTILPTSCFAFTFKWNDLWQTPDQQGTFLLKQGRAREAAQKFANHDWRAIAHYRAEDYTQALQEFSKQNSSDGQYNAGNAYAYLGRYQEAILAYSKALELNPHNKDAIFNRELIKKLLKKKQQNQKDQQNQEKQQNQSNDQNPKDQQPKDNQHNRQKLKKQKLQAGQDQNKQNQSEQQQNSNSDPKSNANPQQKQANQQQDEQQNEQKNEQQNENAQQKQNLQSQQNQKRENQQSQNQQNNQNQQGLNQQPLSSFQNKNSADADAQVLRRLDDDPGGLLKQKFLRDYLRRHATNPEQGANG